MEAERNYLFDVLNDLVATAKEAKAESLGFSGSDHYDRGFTAGRALAYYEVVSHLIIQAEAFELSKERYPAMSFNPDKELL